MANVPDFGADLLKTFDPPISSWVADSMRRLGIAGWTEDIHPLVPTWRFAGRARTVRYGAVTGMVRSRTTTYSFADQCQPHDVIVLAAGGTTSWLLGENVINRCLQQGVRAVVIDGRVRDLAELLTMKMPVFAKGAAVKPPSDLEIVETDCPVEFGGAQIRPGDLLVGDADGIAIVPAEAARAMAIEVEDLGKLEKEQEELIRKKAPYSEIQRVMGLKKIRKGPAFDLDFTKK